MALLIKNALILAPGSEKPIREGGILIEEGEIRRVFDQGSLPDKECDQVIDAAGKLVAPGFINAHAHSPLSILKGTTDRLDHPRFMWLNQADTAQRSVEVTEAASTIAAADMVRYGITTVIDHVPEQNASLDAVEPIERAWRRAGMRVALALRIFDGSYDDIGANHLRGQKHHLSPLPAPELLDMCRAAIDRWHSPQSRISVFVAPSNSERCSDELLVGGHELAERHDTGFHMHMLETDIQRNNCIDARGMSPIARLRALGTLTPRTSLAHTIWVDEDDVELLAEAKATVVHNPHSNLKLGAGIMPLGPMHRAGVRVALGTDGASTNDTQCMQEVMTLALLLQRSVDRTRSTWLDAKAAIEMATTGGCFAFAGTQQIGEIREGARADLVFYDLNSLDLCPANDVLQQLVFAERGRSIQRVMVDGKTVYSGGASTNPEIDDALNVVRDFRRIHRERHPEAYALADEPPVEFYGSSGLG